ncbi:hypothetical protein DE146DRAFT_234416 [Phaeosphaeria sp. MPI-PUGE-AT-0046c]|nr:hypothetical protein DE146DRAFT_234416 [Phaeosphaeria sp. MPI-PUGE-AT-0046c]
MGENRSALDAPAKEGFLPSTLSDVAEAEAPAIPGFNTPIPAAVPKSRLPLPTLPSGSSNSDATPAMESSPSVAKQEWNTSKLGLRVGVDALSAGAAGALVAPIITMIDKGIIENASGRNTLGDSLKQSAKDLLLRPHRFIASKPFLLIFSLYFGTYFTANTIDTASSSLHSTPASSTTAGTTKFLAVSTSNLALCLYKDNKFTQLFGSTGSKRPVPLPTFALFTVRDCMTIFASFNLPPLLAPKMEQYMSEGVQRYMSSASAAQFITPAAVQLLSTPLHLLGLDLYNRPGVGVGGPDGRAARVLRDWAKSAAARMCRIVPAFGVGGVVNSKVRKGMMEDLE